MDPRDQRVLDDIEKFGCHVINVAAGGDGEPPFSYSVGIQKTCGAPEVIVVGLRYQLAHSIVNNYKDRVRAGEKFERGRRYADFLEGFAVYVEPAGQAAKDEYMRFDLWLYGGSEFNAVQIIYPTTMGVWPWDPEASEWFRSNQPLLGVSPVGDEP